MRYLFAGTHPGHGSICVFRVHNNRLLASNFPQDPRARRMYQAAQSRQHHPGGGRHQDPLTKASKRSAVSHGSAVEQMRLLEEAIATLLARPSMPTEPCCATAWVTPSRLSAGSSSGKALSCRRRQARAGQRTPCPRAGQVLKEAWRRGGQESQSRRKPCGKTPKPPQNGPAGASSSTSPTPRAA